MPSRKTSRSQLVEESDDSLIDGGSSSDGESDGEGEKGSIIKVDIAESVYFEFVVTCCRNTGWVRKGSSLFLLALAIGLGMMFVTIMIPAISDDPIKPLYDAPDTFADSDMEGHVNAFSIFKDDNEFHQDRAYWTCNRETWNFLENVLNDDKDYTSRPKSLFNTVSRGRLFGFVSMFLWLALIVKEIKDIMEYSMLLCLPTGPAGQCYNRGRDGASIEALPAWVKVIIVAVIIFRLVINAYAGYWGTIWLAHTTTLGDFILNSLALGFIYELDEFIYAIFTAKSQKRHLSAVGSVPIATAGWVHCVLDRFKAVLDVGLVVVLVAVANHYILAKFATHLRKDVFCAACAPNGNFPQCSAFNTTNSTILSQWMTNKTTNAIVDPEYVKTLHS